MSSKTINLVLGKNLIDKGIENLYDIVKFGASEIKNKNIQRVLDSDIVNYVAEGAESRVQNQRNKLK